MPNLQNRTRVVYVRVSENEFQKFRELCQRQGAKNMSDMVRGAMEELVRQRGTDFEREVAHRLRQLEISVDNLREIMKQITVRQTA